MWITDSAPKTLRTIETKSQIKTILNFKCVVFSLHIIIRGILHVLVLVDSGAACPERPWNPPSENQKFNIRCVHTPNPMVHKCKLSVASFFFLNWSQIYGNVSFLDDYLFSVSIFPPLCWLQSRWDRGDQQRGTRTTTNLIQIHLLSGYHVPGVVLILKTIYFCTAWQLWGEEKQQDLHSQFGLAKFHFLVLCLWGFSGSKTFLQSETGRDREKETETENKWVGWELPLANPVKFTVLISWFESFFRPRPHQLTENPFFHEEEPGDTTHKKIITVVVSPVFP